MLRHRFGPAMALGAVLLTCGSVRAQIVYEFVDATTGLTQNNFIVPIGGTLPIRVYLHELTPGAPMFHSAGGLGSAAVALSFANPPGVAGLSLADITPATTTNGGAWDFGTPTLSPSGTSASVSVGQFTTGVAPDASGRVLLGTFALHGQAPGILTLTAADPNPLIAFDTSSFAAGANFIPLINYDPLITAGSATLTVTPVPEPSGLLVTFAVAAGLIFAARRLSPTSRAASPAPSDPAM